MERGNMNAQQVISIANNAGLKLGAKDGELIIQGIGEKQTTLTPELRSILTRWKPDIINILKPKTHILRLVIDGKGATCIDTHSADLDEAFAKQRKRWGGRLTLIECANAEHRKV